MCMLHGKRWGLCALTGAEPLCPGLSRAGYTGQVQGTLDLDWLLTHDIGVRNLLPPQHTSLPQHQCEMEGPRQTNACGARTVPSDWHLECSGRNSGLVTCFLLLTYSQASLLLPPET